MKENFIWLDNEDAENFTLTVEEMSSWLKEGPPIVDIKTQSNYCDQEFLNKVVEAKVRNLFKIFFINPTIKSLLWL